MALSILVQKDKVLNPQGAGDPCLTFYMTEVWTPNRDLKRRINVFTNECLRRIIGYRRNDWFMFDIIP